MLFNSYVFIFLFLPLCLFGYFAFNRFKLCKAALAWLCLCSLVFYAYFNIYYAPIIAGSVVFNYLAASLILRVQKAPVKRTVLIIAVLVNIGVLFYYKYTNFFLDNINLLFRTGFTFTKLILPLGISFFTFQQVSYVIDTYRGTAPKYPFLSYANFILFFPQLIAGPICLHSELVPQFNELSKRRFDFDNFAKGLTAFAFGLAKKLLIADTFGLVADWGFGSVAALDTTNALLAVLAYTLQIYFDFSGYCDMATGISWMFNIEQPMNFNSPYRAVDIRDFWNRWHMTLTRFFSAYVYIPLGGNRKGKLRTYFNVLAVFLISGLWHGSNYTFILWGAVHGLFSVLTRRFQRVFDKLHPAAGWILTFIFVNLAWVLFRANSVSDALTVYKNILKLDFGAVSPTVRTLLYKPYFLDALIPYLGSFANLPALFICGFALFASVQMKNTHERIADFRPSPAKGIAVCLLLTISILSVSGVSTFLYWNF